jgi:hypothetical protein
MRAPHRLLNPPLRDPVPLSWPGRRAPSEASGSTAGVYRPEANLLTSAPSEAPRTRAPSLHRHYPASAVLWAPPTPPSARPLQDGCRSATPAPRGASHVATHSVSTCRLHYPGESPGRMAVSSHPDAAAFPVLAAGRHSRLRLSRPAQSSLTLRPADLLAPLERHALRFRVTARASGSGSERHCLSEASLAGRGRSRSTEHSTLT